jgi:hypothetical protein
MGDMMEDDGADMPRRNTIQTTAKRAERRTRSPRKNRMKLSTTVAAENFLFLESMIRAKRAGSIAEAVDLAVERLRRIENRSRLETATARYFATLSEEERNEDRDLVARLNAGSRAIDVDCEP